VLERKSRSTWTSVARITVGAGGYFRWRGRLTRGSVVRVHASGLVGAPLTIT
jgi:hypothetical protein